MNNTKNLHQPDQIKNSSNKTNKGTTIYTKTDSATHVVIIPHQPYTEHTSMRAVPENLDYNFNLNQHFILGK